MNPRDAQRILVFGGSFDPPHRAHIELPTLVREACSADLILYIPTGIPPHKPDRELTAAHHRVAMLELALQGIDYAIIDTIEIERAADNQPTYTVDTLEAIHERYPNATFNLLIGADQMRDFHTWRQGERIRELAEPIVMARGDEPLPDASWQNQLVQTPKLSISATELRQRIRDDQPIDEWIAPPVADYIKQHNLYKPVSA